MIAGFEPLDVMLAIRMLIAQLNEGRASVENEFTRGVSREGNRKAQALVADVFEMRSSFEWRGLGRIAVQRSAHQARVTRNSTPNAALRCEERPVPENKACQCPAIIRGVKKPTDCAIFGTVCTPRNPIGSCMVSGEGACAVVLQIPPRHCRGRRLMRILLLVHSFNSLAQRLYVELTRDGHELSVEFDIHDDVTPKRWRCSSRTSCWRRS